MMSNAVFMRKIEDIFQCTKNFTLETYQKGVPRKKYSIAIGFMSRFESQMRAKHPNNSKKRALPTRRKLLSRGVIKANSK